MALMGGGSGGGSASGIKAGSAYVTLGLKNFLPQHLASASKQWHNFGDQMAAIGKKMALASAASFAPLVGAFSTLNDVARQGAVGTALGLTAEQFSGIAGVAKSVGNDTKEFVESLVTLGKLGTDAANGTEQAAAAFASMGLNAADFIKLRADEQFYKVFEAIGAMQDPLQRTRALMMAFGEDGGKLLLPLLSKSSEELRNMAKGFAISGDDMKAATSASASYAAATSALGKAWTSVSIAAAPMAKIIAESISAAANPFRQFIDQNREVVIGLGLASAGVGALGVGLMVLGPAIKALTASWGLFTGAIVAGKAVIAGAMAVVSAPILLIPAALAGAGAAWLAFTDRGNAAARGWAASISEALGPTVENLRTSLSSIFDSLNEGDFAGAFRVGLDAVKVEWARFMLYLQETWSKFNVGWERAIDATGIALVRLGRRLGIYSPQEAKDIEKQLLDMNAQAEKQLANPLAVKEARVELANAMDWQRWNLKELAAGKDWGGAGGDWGAAAGGNLAAQIASIGAQSRGGWGGGANVGMFGGGSGVEKIVKGLKDVEKAVERNGRINVMRGDIIADAIMVHEGG